MSILKSKSKKNLKGIKVSINSEFWGEAYARSGVEPAVEGVIDRWQDEKKETLMIMWTGYARNQAAPLDKMKYDELGCDLMLELVPDKDGKVPTADEEPEEAPPAPPPRAAEEDVDPTSVIDSHGQQWQRKPSNFISSDARAEKVAGNARFKPSLNRGAQELDTIESLFEFLLPPEWLNLFITYTNHNLSGADATNAKLDESGGEAKRFFGYMISLSVHTGIPLDKMWQIEPPEDSTAAAPAMGRFGLTKNRFNKLRSAARFGPSDPAALAANDWCFVEPLVDAYADGGWGRRGRWTCGSWIVRWRG